MSTATAAASVPALPRDDRPGQRGRDRGVGGVHPAQDVRVRRAPARRGPPWRTRPPSPAAAGARPRPPPTRPAAVPRTRGWCPAAGSGPRRRRTARASGRPASPGRPGRRSARARPPSGSARPPPTARPTPPARARRRARRSSPTTTRPSGAAAARPGCGRRGSASGRPCRRGCRRAATPARAPRPARRRAGAVGERADLAGHGVGVGQAGLDPARAVVEERDRVGRVQPDQRQHRLARHPERHPARGQDPQLRAAAAAGRRPTPRPPDGGARSCPARAGPAPSSVTGSTSSGRPHALSTARARSVAGPAAASSTNPCSGAPGQRLDRQAGLAAAARPDDRHQPLAPHQRRQVGELRCPPHERRRGGGRGHPVRLGRRPPGGTHPIGRSSPCRTRGLPNRHVDPVEEVRERDHEDDRGQPLLVEVVGGLVPDRRRSPTRGGRPSGSRPR